MRKPVIYLAFLICLATTGAAQAQEVKGKIIDLLTGNGMADVEVSASIMCITAFGTPGCSGTNRTKTEANGRYQVSYPFCSGGSSCATRSSSFGLGKPGYLFVERKGPNNDRDFVGIRDDLPRWSNFSAASYWPAVASEIIAAAFGVDLASRVEIANEIPLPAKLAGRTITVIDYAGTEKQAQLFFVSPTQVNYLMPEGLAAGPAIVLLNGDNGFIRVNVISMQKVFPGIFTADASGRGVAAAVILRVRADGSRQYEPVAQYNDAERRWVPMPIDLGPETDRIILSLFGTGWRQIGSMADVTVELIPVVDRNAPGNPVRRPAIQYAGRQPTIPGLDQINIELPRDLVGKGETSVAVRVKAEPNAGFDYTSNVVQIFVK